MVLVSSPDADLALIVNLWYWINLWPVWKTYVARWLINLDLMESWCKVQLSEVLGTVELRFYILILWNRNVSWTDSRAGIAHIYCYLCGPSSFGAETVFMIHGAGPSCSSILPSSCVWFIALLNRSWRWNGDGAC